jgi:hypothetical protein
MGEQLLEWDVKETEKGYEAVTILNGEKIPFVVFRFDGCEILSSIVLTSPFGSASIAMDGEYDEATDTIKGVSKSSLGLSPFSGVRATEEDLHVLF